MAVINNIQVVPSYRRPIVDSLTVGIVPVEKLFQVFSFTYPLRIHLRKNSYFLRS